MNEKLQILKDSIDQIFASHTFAEYQTIKHELDSDAQFMMYKYVLNNKPKFSTKVYNRAKLKYVNKQMPLKASRKELDQAFNKILSLYDEN